MQQYCQSWNTFCDGKKWSQGRRMINEEIEPY